MLNLLQQYAFNIMMAGYDTLVIGGAGTGKSYLVRKFVDKRRAQGYNIIVVAPTALAAMNVDGVTIHEQFRITYSHNTLDRFVEDENVTNDLVDIDILLMDEVSMCRMDVFDYMINYVNRANEIRKRRGLPRIQIILVGDFLQLPPVIRADENEVLNAKYNKQDSLGMAFESRMWKFFEFKTVILLEIVRQDNKEFVENLNKMRIGNKDSINYIIDNSCKTEIQGAITLYGTNHDASLKNSECLARLDTPLITAEAEYIGGVTWKDTIAEPLLQIKVGARVMTIANSNSENSWNCKNGEFGYIEYIDLANDVIYVRMDDNRLEIIGRYEWKVYRYDIDRSGKTPVAFKNEIGSVKQYPIRLAYAITMHKAQGQTFDAMNIKPYAWDCGQLYMAFSRVRKVENLHIIGEINRDDIIVSLNVIKFYNSLVKKANKDVDTSVNLIEHKQVVYENNDMNKLLSMLGGK